jgi:hypothetical protein
MDVEIVLDQNDGAGVGEVEIGQIFQDVSVVHRGVAIGDFDMAPAFERCKRRVGDGLAGWGTRYDDGGLSGGTLERPALQTLLADIRARKVDIVVVYKVDRLTRSLADFAKLVEVFEAHGVSFVAVTQQFNTTSSMGRLTPTTGA